ncbi:UNVERIFIED_ORG: hypothetical protein J2W65_001442 [Pseudomonas parafulva]|jgi:hypothetical protein|uniref:Uncharacterized protein n=1 Tax=Pseudomonas fulva TaxID=47880 RepID=A0A7S9L4D3_9PSED|nr:MULTISPECIES: hypothetical protein [Pseudomonas]MCY4127347.1 hypothetical protein [Pseudomonas sp.]MDP9555834.1 hypothetical protein [Pseudomonas parafulva]MBN6790139.1 hypothetical protein [Pseudomonas fulva]MBN6795044.1 hypothetical protein [Pseudomonas fulva]MBN6855704.1 hypothetical protein [Pseudomonas fulva]
MDYSSMVESLNKMLKAASDERERAQACAKAKDACEKPRAEAEEAEVMAQLPGSQVWVYEGRSRKATTSAYAVRGHGR